MTQLEKRRNAPIEPFYAQSAPNQSIDLGKLAVQFEHKGTPLTDTASFVMRFTPDDRLEIIYPLDNMKWAFGLELISDPCKRLALVGRGISFDAICCGTGSDRGGAVFVPARSGIKVTPPSNAISTSVFHLFNFPHFIGPEDYALVTGEPPYEGGRRCDRATLRSGGWTITISATEQTDENTKALEAHGGYVLTHMGRIEREDGSTFSSEQLDTAMGGLHHFLSFALGRWAGVAFPVGFDADGKKCHEEWGMPMTADGRWSGGSSWFDRHHGDLLSQVYPGFVSLWTNSLWRQPLSHAIYWYVGASDRRVGIGVDTGLMLAQTCLELLAWTYCILDRKMVPPSDFKHHGLSAAEKLRLLASSLGIPKEIPSHLSALHAKPGDKWTDGMHAVTSIRNSLVHPDAKKTFPPNSYCEAWNLSLWYIEMVLLRLCGHEGNYSNRLAQQRWVGEVERVPWAVDESAAVSPSTP